MDADDFPGAARQPLVAPKPPWDLAGLAGAGLACALVATALLSGCGTSVNTSLPDLAAKNVVPESGVKPLTSAEQKQAIDAMIAKREAQKNETK